MIKLVIIADDLTGALDTGVQFTKKNMSVAVTQNLDLDFEKEFSDRDVVVIDTESRHISKEEAKEKVKAIISKFSKDKIEFFYKKVDSTLRGNIGSEIEGFVESIGINEVSFIPAFPSGKRIVKNGILYVDGIKLENTQFAHDILNPINDSYISEIIKKQSKLEVEKADINNLKLSKSQNFKIYLFDSENNNDMEIIGAELFKRKLLNYTVGNAGFAEVLANYIDTEDKKEEILIEDKKIFFVCGSVNIVSLEQCKVAEEIGFLSKALKFDNIISENYISSNKYVEDKRFISDKFKISEKVLLKTSDSDKVIENALNFSKSHNIPIEKLTKIIADNTGRLVTNIIKENGVRNLIVFGGDTLIGILKNIECEYIIPIKEILPGVVFTKVVLKNKSFINVITKAGGFGEKNLITKVDIFLKDKYKKMYNKIL